MTVDQYTYVGDLYIANQSDSIKFSTFIRYNLLIIYLECSNCKHYRAIHF